MVVGGREVIVGVSRDPQFGPLLMFGMGGIYVEVLGDVSFRVIPISRADAVEMIQETKAYRLLRGLRGERPADVEAVISCLLRVSGLVADFPQIVELDINPLSVGGAGCGAVAVDARMLLDWQRTPVTEV